MLEFKSTEYYVLVGEDGFFAVMLRIVLELLLHARSYTFFLFLVSLWMVVKGRKIFINLKSNPLLICLSCG